MRVFVGTLGILRRNRIGLLMVLAAGLCVGQTRIDLRGQARNVDFSGAAATKPVKVADTLPAACSAGEQVFLRNAAAGDNLHLCTATNTWTPIKSSAMLAPGNATDCRFIRFSSNVLKMSSCSIRVGTKNWTLPETEFVLSPAAPSDTVYFYVLNGSLVAGYNSTAQILSGTGFAQTRGITAPPGEAAPVGMWGATAIPGQWNETGTDLRATVESSAVSPGIGIVATDDPATGVRNLSVDTGVIPVYDFGAATPPARCTVGQIYIRTDTNTAYHCTSADTWRATGGGSAGGTYEFTAPMRESAGKVDCPACVTAAGSYADPAWVTSLGWSKLTGVPPTFTPANHSHTAGDIGFANKQGTGSKFQMFGGGTAGTNDCAKFDGAGNIVSAGSPCAAAAGGSLYAFSTPLRESAGTVDCPSCVTTAGSYADPAWVTSLGWSKLMGVPSAFTPAGHSHTAADIAAADKQGAGAKVQMFGGGTVNTGDCANFDAAGNIVSAGAACGGGTGSPGALPDNCSSIPAARLQVRRSSTRIRRPM